MDDEHYVIKIDLKDIFFFAATLIILLIAFLMAG